MEHCLPESCTVPAPIPAAREGCTSLNAESMSSLWTTVRTFSHCPPPAQNSVTKCSTTSQHPYNKALNDQAYKPLYEVTLAHRSGLISHSPNRAPRSSQSELDLRTVSVPLSTASSAWYTWYTLPTPTFVCTSSLSLTSLLPRGELSA